MSVPFYAEQLADALQATTRELAAAVDLADQLEREADRAREDDWAGQELDLGPLDRSARAFANWKCSRDRADNRRRRGEALSAYREALERV